MSIDLEKIEEKITIKREQVKKLNVEIIALEAKIKNERQTAIVKAVSVKKLNSNQYKQLAEAIADGSIMKLLEEQGESRK